MCSTMAERQVRVMLLCCPRSTSTLFTKAMSTVPGSQIFMDSHYFCHMAEMNLKEMGKPVDYDLPDEDWRKAAEMLVGEYCGGNKLDISKLKFPNLKAALDNPRADAPFVFCKTVCQPVSGRYDVLPEKSSNYRYTFLLRHPLRVFVSLRKALFDALSYKGDNQKAWHEFHFVRDVPEKHKIREGRLYKDLYEEWIYVKENLDPNPVIIDSDDVLSDPAHMLSKYCDVLGIPYSDSMIAWDGDPTHADSWWQPFNPIYDLEFGRICVGNAVFSKGFIKPKELPNPDDVFPDVRECYEFVKPFYEVMYKERLKP